MHSVSDDHAKGEQQWNGLRFTLDSLFLAARAAKSVCTCLSSVPSSVCAIEPGAKCAEGLFHPPLDSQRGVHGDVLDSPSATTASPAPCQWHSTSL